MCRQIITTKIKRNVWKLIRRISFFNSCGVLSLLFERRKKQPWNPRWKLVMNSTQSAAIVCCPISCQNVVILHVISLIRWPKTRKKKMWGNTRIVAHDKMLKAKFMFYSWDHIFWFQFDLLPVIFFQTCSRLGGNIFSAHSWFGRWREGTENGEKSAGGIYRSDIEEVRSGKNEKKTWWHCVIAFFREIFWRGRKYRTDEKNAGS